MLATQLPRGRRIFADLRPLVLCVLALALAAVPALFAADTGAPLGVLMGFVPDLMLLVGFWLGAWLLLAILKLLILLRVERTRNRGEPRSSTGALQGGWGGP